VPARAPRWWQEVEARVTSGRPAAELAAGLDRAIIAALGDRNGLAFMAVFSGLDDQRGGFRHARTRPSDAFGIEGGTVMRYALPVPPLPLRPGSATRRRLPIATPSLAKGFPPRGPRAGLPAVALPPVAVPANHHRCAATGAVVTAMTLWLLLSNHIQATRGWT